MKSLTIKTHAESKREHEFFQAILTLAGSVLTHDWRIVETDPADVVIISFNSTEPYSAWDEYAEKYPLERLIAYTDENTVKDAHWHIQRAPESMPRLSDVVRVLNNAAKHFSSTDVPRQIADALPPEAQPEPETAVQNALEYFHPDRHLAGIIQQAIDDGQCRACHLADGPPVYIVPAENAVYTAANLGALSSLCRTDIDHIHVAILPESGIREHIASAETAKRRPLPEFLWFSLLTGSNGRLLEGCAMEEAVHLREWPEHVRLSFYSMYHDIVTQMASGWIRLDEIAQNSAAPIQNVIDLHNACTYHGLIARGEEGRWLATRKTEARERLRSVLKPFSAAGGYVRLVVVGNVGSGKTTALTTLSETPPIFTEANPSDAVSARKATTTVAMEYGDIRLHSGAKLQIYGTPGQKRFNFMGEILCGRAWGVLILIDNTEADPLAELKYYLESYADTLPGANIAIGVSHYDRSQSPSLETYRRYLGQHGYAFPVAAVDPRDADSLTDLIAAIVDNRRQTMEIPVRFEPIQAVM